MTKCEEGGGLGSEVKEVGRIPLSSHIDSRKVERITTSCFPGVIYHSLVGIENVGDDVNTIPISLSDNPPLMYSKRSPFHVEHYGTNRYTWRYIHTRILPISYATPIPSNYCFSSFDLPLGNLEEGMSLLMLKFAQMCQIAPYIGV